MKKFSKPQNREDIDALRWKLSNLESQLTGEMDDYQFDLMSDIGEIRNLLMNVDSPPKPVDTNFECFGCGS
jgi:hypothetical protein